MSLKSLFQKIENKYEEERRLYLSLIWFILSVIILLGSNGSGAPLVVFIFICFAVIMVKDKPEDSKGKMMGDFYMLLSLIGAFLFIFLMILLLSKK